MANSYGRVSEASLPPSGKPSGKRRPLPKWEPIPDEEEELPAREPAGSLERAARESLDPLVGSRTHSRR